VTKGKNIAKKKSKCLITARARGATGYKQSQKRKTTSKKGGRVRERKEARKETGTDSTKKKSVT
jgi:hypothetical protein